MYLSVPQISETASLLPGHVNSMPHVLFIHSYFSVLLILSGFLSFFLRVDLVWKEETGTMGGSTLT